MIKCLKKKKIELNLRKHIMQFLNLNLGAGFIIETDRLRVLTMLIRLMLVKVQNQLVNAHDFKP